MVDLGCDQVHGPTRERELTFGSGMRTVFCGLALVLVLTTRTACPNNRDNTPEQNTDAEQGSSNTQP